MSHDHDHADDIALRVRAIEALLSEKGYLTTAAVDRLVSAYENDIGPMLGAKAVARAWQDAEFRKRLLADGTTALRELGIGGFSGENLVAVENRPGLHNVVVCTLCSCYPWSVLGLPPTWYKSPEYRARVVREPRAVLREFGLELPAATEIKVWDSSAEIRYVVVPERPPGTEQLDDSQLAALITRESMIGTGLPRAPA
jgi:nitrile hydratase